MNGGLNESRNRGATILSRLVATLHLLAVIAVLQWSAPSVDPGLLARLQTGGGGDAGLALADRSSPPVIEARAAASAAVLEKRHSTGENAGGADSTALADNSAPAQQPHAIDRDLVPAHQVWPYGTISRAFSARAPPSLG